MDAERVRDGRELRSFLPKLLLATLLVVVLLLAWRLANLFVLAFGAIVVATALRVVAAAAERYARVPPRWSLAVTVLLVAALLAGTAWLLGDLLVAQIQNLRERLPAAVEALVRWLRGQPLGVFVLEYVEGLGDDVAVWARRLAGVAGMTLGALGSALLMVVMGVYLAASPSTYRDGLVRLVPPPVRPRVRDALQASAVALSHWLLGQFLSMVVVGSATALGLWLLGVPLAATVGLITGLLAFIPFIGAFVGGLLAVLLGFVQGPQTALHVLLLYLAIQQVEGHVLVPLVQRWAVNLPPVLGLLASVMFGVLFGVLGVLLATPMMVILMVLVQKLYVQGVLEQQSVPPAPPA